MPSIRQGLSGILVNSHEANTQPPRSGRDEHVDRIGQRQSEPDPFPAQCRKAGDSAPAAGVQYGGDLALTNCQPAVVGQIDAGQHDSPEPVRPEPVSQSLLGQSSR